MLWVKFDKNFFNLESNLFLGAVYIPPKGSTYLKENMADPFALGFDIGNLGQGKIKGCGTNSPSAAHYRQQSPAHYVLVLNQFSDMI